MTQTQHVVVLPDPTGTCLTIAAVTGRLPKAQADYIRSLLRGASVVKTVGRCRRGRLSVKIEGENAHEAVIDLIVRDEAIFEKRARREAERSDDIELKQGRRDKVLLADAGRVIESPSVVGLIDGIEQSWANPALDDSMPIFPAPTTPQIPESIRHLDAQFAAA
ncbi:MAG TPA: hypothetical protein VG964_04400 [Candidatus Saccharimonadales bacterium]|nr:hypothetical protein [Candidatus Saccharimonadales bacterium]